MVITIGLMQWSFGDVKIKPKRGQRLAVRVNVKDPYMNILEKAKTKWKHFYSDTYKEDEEYVLSYSDGKSAQFLPGTCQSFDLQEYKKETGKDYKRIVLFLCTMEDYLLSESGGAALDDLEEDFEPPGKVGRMFDYDFRMDTSFFETDASQQSSVDEGKPAAVETIPLPILSSAAVETIPLPVQGPSIVEEVVVGLGSVKSDPSPKNALLTYTEKVQNIALFLLEIDRTELAVRRRKIWTDTSLKLKRLFKDGVKPLSIRFIGEAGVDAGGPKKEFFSLIFTEAKKILLTTGNGSNFTFLHDVEKCRNGDFRLFGSLLAMAQLEGCAGPRCFMPSVVARLFNGSAIQPSLEDIPDLEMQMKLKELLDAESEAEFQTLMDSFPERYMCGVTRMHVKYSDRGELIQDIAQHFCLSLCNEEIQEVRKGLDVLGLLHVLEEHYEESKLELLLSSKDTASNITSLYTTIEYSEGKEKEAEEDIYYNFTNFLEKLEHEGSLHLMKIELNEDGSETETTKEINLQEVAQFCTGSRFITSEMKGKGTISFDKARKYGTVVVNTCSVGLTFPVTERYSASPDVFIESFTEDMRTGTGFGMV